MDIFVGYLKDFNRRARHILQINRQKIWSTTCDHIRRSAFFESIFQKYVYETPERKLMNSGHFRKRERKYCLRSHFHLCCRIKLLFVILIDSKAWSGRQTNRFNRSTKGGALCKMAAEGIDVKSINRKFSECVNSDGEADLAKYVAAYREICE